MKNGIAISVNTEMPENVLWAQVRTTALTSITGNIANIDERPMAIEIGTPHISITINATAINNPHIKAISINFYLLTFL